MKSGSITNGLLTIIALCLVAIAGRQLGIIQDASAQYAPGVQRVFITGWQNDRDHGPLPVMIMNSSNNPVLVSPKQ
jgi:hypothetical protein